MLSPITKGNSTTTKPSKWYFPRTWAYFGGLSPTTGLCATSPLWRSCRRSGFCLWFCLYLSSGNHCDFTKTTIIKILINKGMTMRTYKVAELVGCPLPQVIVGLHWSSTAAGEGLAWSFWTDYCTIHSICQCNMFDRSTRFTFVEEESVLAPQFSFLRLPPSTAWTQNAFTFFSVYSKGQNVFTFAEHLQDSPDFIF